MSHERLADAFWLEQELLGELSTSHTTQPEEERQAQIEILRRDNAQILARYPIRTVSAEIHRRYDKLVTRRRRILFGALAGVAALLLAGLLLPQLAGKVPYGASTERAKGSGPSLLVFRQGPPVQQLRDGQRVAGGDLLQLGYRAGGAAYGAILSLDGKGRVTLHYPATPEASTHLERKEPTLLAFSFELDDAPRFERFFFITASHPLDAKVLIKKVRAQAPGARRALVLDEDLRVVEVLLRKEGR